MNASICCILKRPLHPLRRRRPCRPSADHRALPDVVITHLEKSRLVPAGRPAGHGFGLTPLTYDVACCASHGRSPSSAGGTSRSPDICHQPTAHWRSAAPRHPIVSTTVKYNHQSPLCFLLYPLCIFQPVSLPPSLPPDIPPLLSLKAETYNLPPPPPSPAPLHRACTYTQARTNTCSGIQTARAAAVYNDG